MAPIFLFLVSLSMHRSVRQLNWYICFEWKKLMKACIIVITVWQYFLHFEWQLSVITKEGSTPNFIFLIFNPQRFFLFHFIWFSSIYWNDLCNHTWSFFVPSKTLKIGPHLNYVVCNGNKSFSRIPVISSW